MDEEMWGRKKGEVTKFRETKDVRDGLTEKMQTMIRWSDKGLSHIKSIYMNGAHFKRIRHEQPC